MTDWRSLDREELLALTEDLVHRSPWSVSEQDILTARRRAAGDRAKAAISRQQACLDQYFAAGGDGDAREAALAALRHATEMMLRATAAEELAWDTLMAHADKRRAEREPEVAR